MLNFLFNIYNQYSEFTANNQVLGAVMAGVGVTSIGLLFRTIPRKIFNFIYSRIIYSVTFNSQTTWNDRMACMRILSWADKYKTSLSSKRALPVFDEDGEFKIGLGLGKNVIKYENNYYLVNVEIEKGSENYSINYEVTVGCLWYKYRILENILNFILLDKKTSGLKIFEWNDKEWKNFIISKRLIETVITTNNVGSKILKYLNDFNKSEKWYLERGIAYKTGIMLYGSPGTGKTSLIKAIATELDRSIYTINLSTTSNSGFVSAIREIPPGSILSLEDIDCVNATHSRDLIEQNNKSSSFGISLATILNMLDGIMSLNNIIIFMSTNHIEKIDPAILRKGRSDLLFNVLPLDSVAVSKYSNLIYGRPVTFKGTIKGCDLQSIILEHKEDYEEFCKKLKHFSEDNNWVESKIKEVTLN